MSTRTASILVKPKLIRFFFAQMAAETKPVKKTPLGTILDRIEAQ
jgi:hypothetical protein